MSASYDDELPTDLDKARAALGITDATSDTTALVTDEHIEAVLTWQGSLDGAVSFLASELATRYAQKPTDVSLPSGLRVSWAKRIDTWLKLAERASPTGIGTSGGGLSLVPLSYGTETTDEYARPPDYWP